MKAYACTLAFLALASCRPATDALGGSDVKGYTNGELRSSSEALQGAERAVTLLEENGWCDLPQSALPRGWSHSDLVRQMACISNKESVFGRDPYGPNTGSCGRAYGFWQVAECHLGTSRGGYTCPNVSAQTLASNPQVAAKCALYVYMDRVLDGRSGLGPWEATCSSSERNMTRSNGQPVFREACGNAGCSSSLLHSFTNQGQRMQVSVADRCGALKVGLIFLNAQSGNVISQSEMHKVTFNAPAQGRKGIDVDISAWRLPEHNVVRIHLLGANDRVVFTTNPSPALPANSDPFATNPATR